MPYSEKLRVERVALPRREYPQKKQEEARHYNACTDIEEQYCSYR
jgi:hypothetical protein